MRTLLWASVVAAECIVVEGKCGEDAVAARAEELADTIPGHIANVGDVQLERWEFRRESSRRRGLVNPEPQRETLGEQSLLKSDVWLISRAIRPSDYVAFLKTRTADVDEYTIPG